MEATKEIKPVSAASDLITLSFISIHLDVLVAKGNEIKLVPAASDLITLGFISIPLDTPVKGYVTRYRTPNKSPARIIGSAMTDLKRGWLQNRSSVTTLWTKTVSLKRTMYKRICFWASS